VASRDTSERAAAGPRRDLPSLLLSGLLLVMGITVLVDAAGVEAPPGAGAVGPAAFMWAIGTALVVLALVLGLVALRGRPDEDLAANPFVPPVTHPEDGPTDAAATADGDAPTGPTAAAEPRPLLRMRPAARVALLLGGLLLHAAIITTAGYIVAAAVLFLCSSLAFGAPRLLPPVLIGTGVAVAIFYGFVWGLGLALPYLGGG
jgi:putative tricarboxylic transport membrane protein